jgi:hypothetical protein
MNLFISRNAWGSKEAGKVRLEPVVFLRICWNGATPEKYEKEEKPADHTACYYLLLCPINIKKKKQNNNCCKDQAVRAVDPGLHLKPHEEHFGPNPGREQQEHEEICSHDAYNQQNDSVGYAEILHVYVEDGSLEVGTDVPAEAVKDDQAKSGQSRYSVDNMSDVLESL